MPSFGEVDNQEFVNSYPLNPYVSDTGFCTVMVFS